MSVRIQLRRDTAANWTSTNPTLTQGEPGYETDTGKIKYGDGSTAWTSLAYASGGLPTAFAAGTAAAPGLAVDGDTNTGIYSPGADQLAISTNGTGRLFVDANGRVAIGRTPVSAGTRATFAVDGIGGSDLYLFTNGTEALSFQSIYPNTTLNYPATGNLYVNKGGSTVATLDSSGRVGVGTTTVGHTLEVRSSSSDGNFFVGSASGPGVMSGYSSGAVASYLQAYNTSSPAFIDLNVNGSTVRFGTGAGATERGRFDSSGRLLVGTSNARTNFFNSNYGGIFQVETANNETGRVSTFTAGSSGGGGPIIALGKHRSNTIGGTTLVANGDEVGLISFQGADGTEFVEAARIEAAVDGTPGANDMPGRLVFSTCADGSSSPTERYRITNSGFHRFNTGNAEASASNFGASIRSDGGIWAYRNVSTFAASQFGGTAGYAQVVGNGNLENTNNSYGAISDIKLKENIVDAGSQWDDLKDIQVRKYNFKSETGYSTHTQIGLIAQEVQETCPGLVRDSVDEETGEVTKTVNYSVLYMKAVKALQEAIERIEILEAKVAALETP